MEARTEHPGARHLTSPPSDHAIGIDLGTTNSALATADVRGQIAVHEIPQLVAAGEIGRRSTLPSFLLLADEAQRRNGTVALPWEPAPDAVAGVFAREEGALVPGRLVSSAKSWLSNARVDRSAPILPWGAEGGLKLSPVQASSRILAHLRDAWNHEYAAGDQGERLERQAIVLTVPASFDEEARELTVQAAQDAGLDRLTLLEEPQAALYAWIAAHRRELTGTFREGSQILVCDVGGGTTDFSVIRVTLEGGEPAFERTAIGEHLLLGGDNLDLALAVLVEGKLGDARLTHVQRQALRRKCSEAKERLLADPALDQVPITILGSGRGVVGGGRTAVLSRAEVVGALMDGFLPLTAPDDVPARDRRVGLRELGLPFESEPAITRHLAAFLRRPSGAMLRPDAVLFNGGFFTPAIARQRVLEALERWFGARPRALENAHPEAAVASGAAFYARLRRHPGALRRLLIKAGSARTYYVGVGRDGERPPPEGGATPAPAALCIVARGTQEGTRFELAREFTVTANEPAAFTLYSSTERTDAVGDLVVFPAEDNVVRHAPLVTAFRYGKRSRRVPLGVRLTAAFTETGTLELWCESTSTDHRWRLSFHLRGDADPLSGDAVETSDGGGEALIAEEALQRAVALIGDVFGSGGSPVTPDALTGELENVLGHGKHAWPLAAIRTMADALLRAEPGRSKGPAYEVRWLNLTGFCVRPGFGSSLDAWRISELRKVYAAGLAYPKEVQNGVEWLVLWQRVAAGFSAGQQRELAQRVAGQLGLGGRKPPHLNPQIEREAWRLLASLERLDGGGRARFGDTLVERVRREPRNASWLWAIARLGARAPLYGPLNGTVVPAVAERWIERLLEQKTLTPDLAAAVAQVGARTGDAARDIDRAVAERAAERLETAGFPDAAARLRTVVDQDRGEAGRIFGETLPEGLRLGGPGG